MPAWAWPTSRSCWKPWAAILLRSPFSQPSCSAVNCLYTPGALNKNRLGSLASRRAKKILALAYQEARSRYDLNRVSTQAAAEGDAWRLSGEKIQVLDGQSADVLIVSARTAGEDSDQDGVTLFLLAPDTPGVAIIPQTRVDNRAAALINLDGVKIGAESIVGTVGHGFQTLSHIVDLATVGLCAEMLGGMSQIFDDTLAYLKTREQFGVVIGSFQALKHRGGQSFHGD